MEAVVRQVVDAAADRCARAAARPVVLPEMPQHAVEHEEQSKEPQENGAEERADGKLVLESRIRWIGLVVPARVRRIELVHEEPSHLGSGRVCSTARVKDDGPQTVARFVLEAQVDGDRAAVANRSVASNLLMLFVDDAAVASDKSDDLEVRKEENSKEDCPQNEQSAANQDAALGIQTLTLHLSAS
eukprot:Amastigsp_a347221_11.p2 type:complete len:187 gc:universal Amastigsp_a347221_11:253-813(+)